MENKNNDVFIIPKNLSARNLYFIEIGKTPLLTREEEIDLAIKISEGDLEAKKELARRNLKLVVSIAYGYLNNGLELDDLIQEGNLGLMKAVEKFDYRKKYKFSSYATEWIKQSIKRALANTGRTVRYPVYIHDSIFSFKKATRKLENKLGRDPELNEIAEYMEIPVEFARKLSLLQQKIISLNILVGEETKTELGDFLVDEKDQMPDEIIFEKDLPKILDMIIENSNLTDKEKQILILRFGLADGVRRSLREVAKILNGTREGIRQVEIRAINKIRLSKYSDEAAAYTADSDYALKKLEEYRENNKKKKKK